jgi:cell wall-associated NlpC family hydrolase
MSFEPSRNLRSIVQAAAAGFAPLMLVVACAGAPTYAPGSASAGSRPPAASIPASTGASTSGSSVGERAAAIAVRQVGVPYRYGGRSTEGFDCSGLVNFAYARAGKNVARTTGELWRQLSPVAAENLRAGDVLFFDIEGKTSHVGLYLGNRRFVHAPSSGREVTVEDLDSGFYRSAFIRGGRPR